VIDVGNNAEITEVFHGPLTERKNPPRGIGTELPGTIKIPQNIPYWSMTCNALLFAAGVCIFVRWT
jgi:hypothetical protein